MKRVTYGNNKHILSNDILFLGLDYYFLGMVCIGSTFMREGYTMEVEYKDASTFIQGRYKHFGKEENSIFTRFLMRTDLTFSHIDYDVKVGKGKPLLDRWSEKTKEMVKSLTMKRIDAIGHAETGIYIFEVQPQANHRSLGQLDTYRYWYLRQKKPEREVYCAVVVEDVDSDVVPLFERKGYMIFNVTEME